MVLELWNTKRTSSCYMRQTKVTQGILTRASIVPRPCNVEKTYIRFHGTSAGNAGSCDILGAAEYMYTHTYIYMIFPRSNVICVVDAWSCGSGNNAPQAVGHGYKLPQFLRNKCVLFWSFLAPGTAVPRPRAMEKIFLGPTG